MRILKVASWLKIKLSPILNSTGKFLFCIFTVTVSFVPVVCFCPQLDPRCRLDPLSLQDLDLGPSEDPPVCLLRWVTVAGF